ncbi:putative transcriptional regulator [Treponema sp. JC4]|uniref:ParB/RepB/Spo0J family partition protein n=1 Tax=Treponema sp. JC4 TaxID=1124982 RepID=UPI00025B0E5D|nr:ParB/RepB/Spo0J family partition protein [Treponema sp. JC4]EID84375.1 putative transcriptional regulator [Treponema sp. JC4]
MKLNDIISMVKDTTQKISEKKTLKIKDIVLIPEFQKLLVMEEDVLEKMKQSMKEEGFKSGHEIHIWKRGKEYILIDGHTRKTAWESLGNKTIPCIIHNFANLEEAKTFAIKEQINRRNLSGQALLDAVASFNFEKGKGHTSGEKGKASEIIAKQIGVSTKTVEKTRVVLKEATPEQLEAIKKDELSMNQVFNQIREKRKEESAEKESDVSASTETETKADAKTDAKTEKPKAKAKTEKQSAKNASKSKTDEAFEKGVRYAISEIRKGISLEDLEKSLSA